ncbi:MAG: hypothetical protein V4717_16255 [Bacteroidota bacterium]
MEKEDVLKKILESGSSKAPADFTANTMLAVEAFATKPIVYEPLVPPLMKRIFITCFGTVLMLVLLAAISIVSPEIDFIKMLRLPDISPETYQKIISGIIVFWCVFVINKLWTKHRWRLFAMHQ